MNNVYILGTIHATHESNPYYGFQHILEEVKKFNPDILCLEIRAQDMKEENSYLREYYPPEMVLLKEKYENQIPVLGFDWRGKDIENKRIGEKISDNNDIFKLMQKDEYVYKLIMKRKALMNPFFNSCTLESCQSEYMIYNDMIKPVENQLDDYLCEHGYHELVNYNNDRDIKINKNLEILISKNDKKRIMIVTGISHKAKIEEYLY